MSQVDYINKDNRYHHYDIQPYGNTLINNYEYSSIYPMQSLQQTEDKVYRNSFQYDEPLSEDESELVYKYYNGIKASQYYKDLQRLQYNKKILELQNLKNLSRSNKIKNQIQYSQSIKKYQTPQKQIRSNSKNTMKKQQYNILNKYDNDQVKQQIQTIVNTSQKKQKCSAEKNKNNIPNKLLNLILKQKNSEVQQNLTPYRNLKMSPQKQKGLYLNKSNLKKNKKKVYGNTIHVQRINQTSKQNQLEGRYNVRSKGLLSSRAKSQNKFRNGKRKRSITNYSHQKIYIPAPAFPNAQTIDHQQFFFLKIKELCNKKIQKRLVLSVVIYKDSKLRHNRHEVGHLMNKYQNQLKMRKQIRDRINKNPRILKKHKMVID